MRLSVAVWLRSRPTRPPMRVKVGLAAVWFVWTASMLQARCADLTLVLAIDASGSIDPAEFALQQKGYAHAFLSPTVQSALLAAGAVDVGVVIWGDTEIMPQILPLRRLLTVSDAIGLANSIETVERRVHGSTGIGRGVAAAIDLLESPGVCSRRRVVNVSGDGAETVSPRPRHHVPLAAMRQRANDLGIPINGLAIVTDEIDLGHWYEDRLITGPGAFVLVVGGFDSFAEAIIEKLDREIRPPEVATVIPAQRTFANRFAFASFPNAEQ